MECQDENISTVETQQQKPKESVVDNDNNKVIELSTNDNDEVKAYLNRGIEYGAQGWYDEAIVEFTGAIAFSTDINDTARAYFGRGIIYRQQTWYHKAIADFTKAIDLSTLIASLVALVY